MGYRSLLTMTELLNQRHSDVRRSVDGGCDDHNTFVMFFPRSRVLVPCTSDQ